MNARPDKKVLERTYRATLEEVWELWTTKEGFESWWGPVGFRVEVHELDARLGGALRYDMIADAPEMVAAMREQGQPISHATHGRFTVVEPRTRLAVTHVIDFVPGIEPFENTMTVELAATGDHVRMTVTLEPMRDETLTRMQGEGFESQLTKLDARFGTR